MEPRYRGLSPERATDDGLQVSTHKGRWRSVLRFSKVMNYIVKTETSSSLGLERKFDCNPELSVSPIASLHKWHN